MSRIVLIVEDSQQCASNLEIALLAIPDVEVAYAGCGDEALAYLHGPNGDRVTALVTDLNMPRMDGFELIRALRSDGRHSRLPIVVLSGDADPRTPARIRELGADAFFPKPYSPAKVRAKVEQLLHAH